MAAPVSRVRQKEEEEEEQEEEQQEQEEEQQGELTTLLEPSLYGTDQWLKK